MAPTSQSSAGGSEDHIVFKIPKGTKAGSTIDIKTPMGIMKYKVPKGTKAGTKVSIALNKKQINTLERSDLDELVVTSSPKNDLSPAPRSPNRFVPDIEEGGGDGGFNANKDGQFTTNDYENNTVVSNDENTIISNDCNPEEENSGIEMVNSNQQHLSPPPPPPPPAPAQNTFKNPRTVGNSDQISNKPSIKRHVVLPQNCYPESIVAVLHPTTNKQVLVRIPPNAFPGSTIELSFEIEEEKKKEIEKMIVQVTVPRKFKRGVPVRLKLPDGRTIKINYPRSAKPGAKFNIKVPKNPGHDEDDDIVDVKMDARKLFDPKKYPNNDADIVEASLNTGIKFDELILVVWRKKETIFRCDMAVVGPALYKFIDKDGNGTITIDDLFVAMEDETILSYVESLHCPVLGKLFHNKLNTQHKAFRKIDTDRSGFITLSKWERYLKQVQYDRLKFYRKHFLLKDYVFMGHGMEPGEPYGSNCCCNCFGVYRGYWDDFKYYTCNNHQLIMMIYVDPIHPYSQMQRIMEFLGCIMTAFFGAGFILDECDDQRKIWLSIILVTIPTYIFRKIIRYLFTMPCLLHDKSKTSAARHCLLLCFADVASGVAYIFSLAWCLFFFFLGARFWIEAYRARAQGNYACGSAAASITSELLYFGYTIAQYWVLWFFAMFCVDFNPFPNSPHYFYYVNKFLKCFSHTQVGRWYIERDMIYAIIREKVEERGIDAFFLPPSAQALSASNRKKQKEDQPIGTQIP